jgi:hypothetical protein
MLQAAPEDERRVLGLPMAALAAADTGIDLEQASEEAMAFLESFPVPGRSAVDLADEASRWLALRTATDQARARLRAALAELAAASQAEFPIVAETLTELASEQVPTDPRQDDLWVALARAIVEARIPDLA